jgi:hypothetical protein
MRRVAIHFNEDILMEEIISMARNAGFHVRITCGLITVDRVPGIVAKDEPAENVVTLRPASIKPR